MITPDRRILPAAQTQLIDKTGRATPTFYDFMRRIIGVTGLTPELIQQLEEIIAKIEELEAGGFLPATANVIGQDSILSQGTLAGGVVTLQLQGDTSDQRSTWYYGSNEDSEKGWFRFYTALATGAGILKRNSGYIELGEVDDPADLPPAGNLGEAYWVDGASDITERGLWAWDGAAWVLDPVATGIVSFEVANADYGDITVTGDGATWTIDPNAVTDAKLRDSAALSVIGRSADTPGDPADIIAAASGSVLTRQSNQVLFTTTPIWEGNHLWIDSAEVQLGTDGDLRIFHTGAAGVIGNSTGPLGITALAGDLDLTASADVDILAGTDVQISSDNVDLIDDNQELRIGAGQDLRLFHDGANSILRNDTGTMNFLAGASVAASYGTLGVWTFTDTPVVPDDSWTYAKIQNVSATNRILGRITAGAGDIEELTGTQVTTVLDVFTSALKGLAPASGGGTANYLRADGTWNAPPGTAGAVGANPTASVGLTAVNGVATTFLRSDGASALSQGIAPTWTAQHIFAAAFGGAGVGYGVHISSAVPGLEITRTGVAADEGKWSLDIGSNTFSAFAINDARTVFTLWLAATRTGTTIDLIKLITPLFQAQGIHNGTLPTGAANQYIASGTYTPTATAETNLDSVTGAECQWIRAGNVVTVSGSITIDPTVVTTTTTFRITLPIASNLTAATQLGGAGAQNYTGFGSVMIRGDAANDAAQFAFTSGGTASSQLYFQFAYVVL